MNPLPLHSCIPVSELQSLIKDREELVEAITPFTTVADMLDTPGAHVSSDTDMISSDFTFRVPLRDFRRARDLLSRIRDRSLDLGGFVSDKRQDMCQASAEDEVTPQRTCGPFQSGAEWMPGETLPIKGDHERFDVYLALSTGSVKLADWIGYTEWESHGDGCRYTVPGDAYYMTEDGYSVRPSTAHDDDRWCVTFEGNDDDISRDYVVAWMEAMKPLPVSPLANPQLEEPKRSAGDTALLVTFEVPK